MLNAKRAVFPGSFDPLTKGHIDIITRSLTIFDELTVAVLSHPRKQELFTAEERVALIREQFSELAPRLSVESFSGLLVDFARQRDINVVIRGLRAISDYDYEAQMALVNRNLCDEIETFFLMTREKYSYISSSIVKEIAAYGGDVTSFVAPTVKAALLKKFANKN